MARDLASKILINGVCPGSILTERTQDAFDRRLGSIAAATPLGRVGTPEDITFLAQAGLAGDPVEIAADWVERYGLGLAVVTLGAGGGGAPHIQSLMLTPPVVGSPPGKHRSS